MQLVLHFVIVLYFYVLIFLYEIFLQILLKSSKNHQIECNAFEEIRVLSYIPSAFSEDTMISLHSNIFRHR